ncbi:two-component regulator propeller domain-containing protein [Undibacterium sp. Ren11W]|uniref:two-component regulator propeller domain-containing protein n=1 Tax=Undibacterium sp. Ren11W TaxID=3413045 RepID=UPI003BF111A9
MVVFSLMFFRRVAKCLMCNLSFLLFSIAYAAPAHNLRFEQLGVSNGLPQESINTFLQDRQGFMWIGTQAGLARFDGYRFVVYKNNPQDPASLIDNYILSSYEDTQGGLWFGTKGGLNHFDPSSKKFTRYIPQQEIPGTPSNRSVQAIARDGERGIWLATEDGLKHFSFATHQFTVYRHDAQKADSLSANKINALHSDHDGQLWIGTANGLDLFQPQQSRFIHIDIQLKNRPVNTQNNVLALAIGPDRRLWIGSSAGLSSVKLGAGAVIEQPISEAAGVATVSVQTLMHDQDENLWIGTVNNGLMFRDAKTGLISNYQAQALDRNSLANNEVKTLLQDRSGTLWVGTWFSAISRVDLHSGGFERLIQLIGVPDSLSENKVRTIIDDEQGRYWLGTVGGGLNRFDPNTGKLEVWRHKEGDKNSLMDDRVSVVAYDQNRRLLIGTRNGLSWFDPKTNSFRSLFLGTGINENYIQTIFTDVDGSTWVGTRGGLYKMEADSSTFKAYRHDANDGTSLVENSILSLASDSQGGLWVGTENGLDHFNKLSAKFKHYQRDSKQENSLLHNRVNYLLLDSKKQLWIGTAGGLSRMINPESGEPQFKSYLHLQRGANESIGAILEDEKGQIWFSSIIGISKLNSATDRIQLYTSKNGLTDGAFFIGSGHKAKDGTLIFGGLNGITYFQASVIRDNHQAPPVVITDFLIFNQSITALSERQRYRELGVVGGIENATSIRLSDKDSVFSIEFSALHFANPQANRYAYQLLGFDQDWVSVDASKRFATYTNLDPGEYIFKVKASNSDGVWNDAGASLKIIIAPPFWKTWWFRVLLLSVLLAIGYLALQWRIRSFKWQKQVLEQEVSLRTMQLQLKNAEVQQQKESLELAHRNMSLLSDIGREITAKLDSESIIMMVYRSVHELMDASVFGIGFYRPEKQLIEYPFAIESGKRYSSYSRDMREPNQFAVWCITHEKEVFINDLEQEYQAYFNSLDLTVGTIRLPLLADGSMPCSAQSMLYVPICVNGKIRGVISVHSHQKNAYQRIHLDMLRTLASYVGVAFDNADAYAHLKETQEQLVEQGKLAALGSLVAGVAHELNTPIGNSLMIASTMQDKTETMNDLFVNATARRSDLKHFIDSAKEASILIMRSLTNAADLINSFKQVAVDQTSAKRRQFNLYQTTHEIIATMMNQVRNAGHTLEIQVPADIQMDSYPGSYGQVIINFIGNVLLHAFDDRRDGHIQIVARRLGEDKVEIVFSDNGVGIKPEDIAYIFNPFFTTKFGQGGSGLGLNISYNIVVSLLEGQIRVESVLGQGTSFILELPLVVSAASETNIKVV